MQGPTSYHDGILCQNGTNASVWSGIMLQNDMLGGFEELHVTLNWLLVEFLWPRELYLMNIINIPCLEMKLQYVLDVRG
jgi:hypothetical protein